MIRNTRKWTRFCENNILGKGFRKTSANSFLKFGGDFGFRSPAGGVWGGMRAGFSEILAKRNYFLTMKIELEYSILPLDNKFLMSFSYS